MNQLAFEELIKAAKPLQEFLEKHFDPMVQIVVEEGSISVLQKINGVRTPVRD